MPATRLAPAMRYFFNLVDGTTKVDLTGGEFKSEAGARQEAVLRALNYEESSRLQKYDGFHCIVVRDETGRVVCKIPIKH